MATRALLLGALLATLLLPTGGSAGLRTAPSNTGEPAVSGRTVQGQTLRTTNGTWSGTTPLTFRYRWLRCDSVGGSCADISGATAGTYVPTADDVGRALRVRVTARNSLGSRSSTSTPTAPVSKAGVPSGQTVSINDVSLPNRL